MREALKGQLDSRAARRRAREARQSADAAPTPTPERRGRVAATIVAAALVAQLAEQRTLNPKVPGSIPGGGTL